MAPSDDFHPVASVVVGTGDPSDGLTDAQLDIYDVLVTSASDPPRPWVQGNPDEVAAAAAGTKPVATTLAQVLRATESMPVPDALVVESLAYSTLQHGHAFHAWMRGRPHRRRRSGDDGRRVEVSRANEVLGVSMRRPEVHNALDAQMRDALCEVFDLVVLDDSITEVHLSGQGPSFCSGGDLDEFGTAKDAAVAHMVRIERSVGRRVWECADRVTAHLHGACMGAGIEIAAFAGRVVAERDSRIRLPELELGLIPGAGGTVSIPRRIGRHRTAWLVLTGREIDADTALDWGLVDALE